MLNKIQENVVLLIQSKTGLSAPILLWWAGAALAIAATIVFLCVSAYAWLLRELGPVYAALVMAGFFLLLALVSAIAAGLTRRHTREGAILQKARSSAALVSPALLLDPKLLNIVNQAARTLGWQRLIPLVVLGLLTAQWAREKHHGGPPRD
jgi:hypothetical protein